MTRVKVCGMRSAEDVRAASRAGADALGFVVASPGSPRELAPSQAAQLASLAPPFVQTLLVTRETQPARLAALQGAAPLDALQVHGLRDAVEAHAVRKAVHGKLVLAVPAGPEARDLAGVFAPFADAILLDSGAGGTGQTHDWRAAARIVKAIPKPVVLAGGLTPANVARAVRAVKPWAVDVSGGVEGAQGKSPRKVQRFLAEVRKVG
ncbi:MAG: phosphoribosylanthranilate isomerase [Halobacteriales archaeon]|nr:phosphoribosylanthranilate isomerase [Halobacteriales archaeon]